HGILPLHDKLLLSTDSPTTQMRHDEIAEMNKISAAILFTSQGGVFFQAGEEFARTKYGNPNSYNASLAINRLDWARAKEYQDLVNYYKNMIAIRKAYSPLRDASKQTAAMIYFKYLPENLLAYSIPNVYDQHGPWKCLFVVANTSNQPYMVDLPKDENEDTQKWTI